MSGKLSKLTDGRDRHAQKRPRRAFLMGLSVSLIVALLIRPITLENRFRKEARTASSSSVQNGRTS